VHQKLPATLAPVGSKPLSLREGYSQRTSQVRLSVCDSFVYPKGVFVKFCKKPKVPEVSKWRQRTTDGTEVCGTRRAEARSCRHCGSEQVKVVASTPACDNALLECQKVTL
jgi:hypothetical protein